MIPEKIGRYRIEGELGRGAMGQVFLAHDPNIGRQLAIKTIPFDTGNAEMRGRFQREAQAAGRLAHPNIVTIYDAGEDHGILYIAMELLAGESLADVLEAGPLSAAQTISIGLQVAGGLAHAHEQNIVHRDIKPANIMVSGTTAKVMDFGVARLAGAGLTATGQVLGTPAYLAPEVIQGQAADARSDIFALGVVLYECLTGKRAFDGDNISNVMFKVLTERPAEPHAAQLAVPPSLSAIVMKAIEKQPSDRFQSCNEFINALNRLQNELPGATASAPQLSRERPRTGTNVAPSSFRVATIADAQAAPAVATLPAPPAPASNTVSAPVIPSRKPGASPTLFMAIAVLVLAVGLSLWWQGREQADATTSGEAKPTLSAQPTMPPPPPKPTTGTLHVESTPSGALISIDGKSSGRRTPSAIELTPGAHRLRLEVDGFNAQQRDITIDAGESFTLHVEMKKRGLLRRLNPF